MAGLLGDVLPWAYSKGNLLKRQVGGLLSDPLGELAQAAGLLADYRREDDRLNALAYADPQRPFRVTDRNALNALVNRAMAGPIGFAPVGMLGATREQQIKEILDNLAHIPRRERVGLRMLPEDVPTPNVGDALRPSTKWVDGVQTNKLLTGTSSIGISRRDEESIGRAIDLLGLFPGARGYYPGNKLAIISGPRAQKGSDAGEAVIQDAVIRYLTDPPAGPR